MRKKISLKSLRYLKTHIRLFHEMQMPDPKDYALLTTRGVSRHNADWGEFLRKVSEFQQVGDATEIKFPAVRVHPLLSQMLSHAMDCQTFGCQRLLPWLGVHVIEEVSKLDLRGILRGTGWPREDDEVRNIEALHGYVTALEAERLKLLERRREVNVAILDFFEMHRPKSGG